MAKSMQDFWKIDMTLLEKNRESWNLFIGNNEIYKNLERCMPQEMDGFKYKIWLFIVLTPFEHEIMSRIVFKTMSIMIKYSNGVETTTTRSCT